MRPPRTLLSHFLCYPERFPLKPCVRTLVEQLPFLILACLVTYDKVFMEMELLTFQITVNWWFQLVVWGFEPLVLVEGLLKHQTTNPNHQRSRGSPPP